MSDLAQKLLDENFNDLRTRAVQEAQRNLLGLPMEATGLKNIDVARHQIEQSILAASVAKTEAKVSVSTSPLSFFGGTTSPKVEPTPAPTTDSTSTESPQQSESKPTGPTKL